MISGAQILINSIFILLLVRFLKLNDPLRQCPSGIVRPNLDRPTENGKPPKKAIFSYRSGHFRKEFQLMPLNRIRAAACCSSLPVPNSDLVSRMIEKKKVFFLIFSRSQPVQNPVFQLGQASRMAKSGSNQNNCFPSKSCFWHPHKQVLNG